jgi:hypothetical protein
VDLIEPELLERDRSHAVIHIYILRSKTMEAVSFVSERLKSERFLFPSKTAWSMKRLVHRMEKNIIIRQGGGKTGGLPVLGDV